MNIVRRVTRIYWENEMPLRAAGISHYVFFALIPILTTLISIALAVPTSRIHSENVLYFLTRWLLPDAIHDVRKHVEGLADNAAVVSAASFVIAIYCLTKIIFFFESSLNRIWRPEKKLISKESGLRLIGKAFVVLVSLFIAITFGVLFAESGPTSVIIELLTTWVFFIGFNKILFYQASWRNVLPGSVVGGLAWYGSKWLFTAYFHLFAKTDQVYAILGSLPVLFLWVQFSVMIFLLSACFNYALQSAE